MVRATLVRRAKRRSDVKTLSAETLGLVEAALAELVELGLIDDARFTEARAASLAHKGLSARRIGMGLRQKGIAREAAAAAGAKVDDLTQARRFAERKRLGRDPARRDRDLRALARAGFSFEIARAALAPEDG